MIGGGGALVGQVVEVGANYSRVLLITDERMNVVGLLEIEPRASARSTASSIGR